MPIIAVIGPSGAGKSTLVDMYLAEHTEAQLHKSVTTRPVRSSGDTSHIFVTDAEFDALEQQGKLIQPVTVYGYRYALPKLPNDTSGTIIVLIRAKFVAPFLASYPSAHVVQIEAPIAVLANRLVNREDIARIDPGLIELEIEQGRSIAQKIIDTDNSRGKSYQEFNSIINNFSSAK